MELTEDEINILRAIAVLDNPTVESVRDRFIGPEVVGDDDTQARIDFRLALAALSEKGLVHVLDGVITALTAHLGLTAAGETALTADH